MTSVRKQRRFLLIRVSGTNKEPDLAFDSHDARNEADKRKRHVKVYHIFHVGLFNCLFISATFVRPAGVYGYSMHSDR